MSIRQFPTPRLRGAYSLSANRQWHYAERFAVAAVEYCCYSVLRKTGAAVLPLRVLDCSTSTGKTPAGRHPKGSHDAGVNLDLGYYGRIKVSGPFVPGPHKNNRMTGPPDPKLLATEAEVEWFLALGRLEVDVDLKLVRLCATDPYIEKFLDPRILTADEPQPVVAEAYRICYSSAGGGWEVFHHHHRHIRFNRLQNGDKIAKHIETKWIQPLLRATPAAQLALARASDDVPDAPDYFSID